MITVLAGGPLTTVQDMGRLGQRALGIGSAGPMDRLALQLGNLLVGNLRDVAGIEIAASGFAVRFEKDTWVALTGADCRARLDEIPILPWWTAPARKGQILSMQAPVGGTFAYLTLAGGIDIVPVIGSRSTDLKGRLGGMEGRALAKDDVLPLGVPLRSRRVEGVQGFGLRPPREVQAQPVGEGKKAAAVLRVLPAAEYHAFTAQSREAVWSSVWTVLRDSSRIGYRLSGTPLQLTEPVELFSHGILPGVVQVPPSGQPVVQMADANTCGGYPKIGVVISADLARLAQIIPGQQIRFIEVTQQEAVAASKAENEYLCGIERFLAIAEMSRLAE